MFPKQCFRLCGAALFYLKFVFRTKPRLSYDFYPPRTPPRHRFCPSVAINIFNPLSPTLKTPGQAPGVEREFIGRRDRTGRVFFGDQSATNARPMRPARPHVHVVLINNLIIIYVRTRNRRNLCTSETDNVPENVETATNIYIFSTVRGPSKRTFVAVFRREDVKN